MNIFVAQLNFKTRKEDLQKVFENFGQVTSVKIVKDRASGRSKGFGFVEMPHDDEAQRAIAALNDTEVEGRKLVVKQSVPKPTAPGPAHDNSSAS